MHPFALMAFHPTSVTLPSILLKSMPAAAYPSFPNDVPTVPLLVIDYALIKAGDEKEIDRLWEAATQLGFW